MTVDDYLQSLSTDQQKLLSSVRNVILKECREAEESISYHMPGYKYLGMPFLYFAAYKDHCSLFGVSKQTLSDFKKELSDFKIVGSTIHFSPKTPLPVSLLKKIIRARMNENKQRKKQAKG